MAGDPASDDPAPAPPDDLPAPAAQPEAAQREPSPTAEPSPATPPEPAPSAETREPSPSASPRPEPAAVRRTPSPAPAAVRRTPSPASRRQPPLVPLGGWQSRKRALLLGLAFLAPCAVIALSVVSILRDTERKGPPVPAPSASVAVIPAPPPPAASLAPPTPAASTPPEPVPSALAPLDVPDAAASDFYEATDDGEPTETKPSPPKPPKRYATVQQAAQESCTTASVEGLSKQIIEQARCIKPNAFVPLPTRSNLVVAPNVFPYLELNAKTQLMKALDANPSRKMTLNSALRTVAQQYLVSRWAAGRRCGVQLATRPGDSNHEIGMALDIAEPHDWRKELESRDFKWLGASDRVHFDYKGSASPPTSTTDVLAFQILWNRNHPTDTLTADGRYTPATEQRLRKAPPLGFPLGPRCGKASPAKRP